MDLNHRPSGYEPDRYLSGSIVVPWVFTGKSARCPAFLLQGRGASLFHAKMFFFLFHFLMKPDFYQGTAVNAYFFSDLIDISNE